MFFHQEVRVFDCVVYLSQGGVALVVERTVWEVEVSQKLPDGVVAPVEDGKAAIELGPAGAALADWLEVAGPGVAPPVTHNDALDVLGVNQLLDLGLEIVREELHPDPVLMLCLLSELGDLRKLVLLYKVHKLDPLKHGLSVVLLRLFRFMVHYIASGP